MSAPNEVLIDPDTEKLYKTAEVAELFSVSGETVRDWVKAGKLPGIRLKSGQIRIRRSDLVDFAKEKYQPGDPIVEA